MGLLPTSCRGALSFDNAHVEAATGRARNGDDKGVKPSTTCRVSRHNAIFTETVFIMV